MPPEAAISSESLFLQRVVVMSFISLDICFLNDCSFLDLSSSNTNLAVDLTVYRMGRELSM